MPGILDSFMNQSGRGNWFADPYNRQALGLLSAHLMAAGAPSYDPGHAQKTLAKGMAAYGDTLARAEEARARNEFREMQTERMKADMEEKRRQAAARDALSGTLLGGYMGGQGPAAGSPRAAQEAGMVPQGLLSQMNSKAGGLLRAYAAADPEAATKLALSQVLKDTEEYTLPPGAARYRGDKLIAERPSKPTALESRVNMLVESGVPREVAQGIASGRYTVSRDPISGTAQVIDKSSGQLVFDGRSQGGGRPDVPTVTPPEVSSSVPSDTDYSKATGASGFFGWGLNTVTDLFAGTLAAPEVERASQGLTNLQVRTQTALQAGVPGRPSNYLMERLDRLAVQPNSVLMGDARAYERIRQTRDMLREEVERMDRDILSHPENFRPQQIADTRANKSQLESLLRNYEVVAKSFENAIKADKSKKARSPAKGTIVDGYEFMGGDPNNRLNWRKAR